MKTLTNKPAWLETLYNVDESLAERAEKDMLKLFVYEKRERAAEKEKARPKKTVNIIPDEVEFDVEFYHQPFEKQTRDDPGCPEIFTPEAIYFKGINVIDSVYKIGRLDEVEELLTKEIINEREINR